MFFQLFFMFCRKRKIVKDPIPFKKFCEYVVRYYGFVKSSDANLFGIGYEVGALPLKNKSLKTYIQSKFMILNIFQFQFHTATQNSNICLQKC